MRENRWFALLILADALMGARILADALMPPLLTLRGPRGSRTPNPNIRMGSDHSDPNIRMGFDHSDPNIRMGFRFCRQQGVRIVETASSLIYLLNPLKA